MRFRTVIDIVVNLIDKTQAALAGVNKRLGTLRRSHLLFRRETEAGVQKLDLMSKALYDSTIPLDLFNEKQVRTMGSVREFFHVFSLNLREFREQTGQFTTLGGRLADRFRRLTHGMRGFRMEMLSVMFFGMGMYAFFRGLLTPAAKLAGVFEIMNMTMEMLFLPITLEYLPALLEFSQKIIELPEETKLWIGRLVLLGAVISLAIMLIGTLTLGVGGVVIAFGKFAPVILGVIAALGLFVGSMVLSSTGMISSADEADLLAKELNDLKQSGDLSADTIRSAFESLELN
ncbi:MAG: hypothetical protein DRP11_00160, partial [Candidatus Aenigmatarchaeota archaeon]